MAFIALTNQGEAFIRNVCKGDGNSLLRGNKPSVIKAENSDYYNPNGVLKYCYPEISADKVWISGTKDDNGNSITTNQELGECLIKWYNEYGKLFEMDANILAAQTYIESNYKIWTYALTSTASGISQFIVSTVYDVIISNKIATQVGFKFTDAEIAAITKNITGGDLKALDTYKVSTILGKTNRPILHQNIIDNPKIMIKAQFVYMKYISKKCDGYASSTLYGYNRGHRYAYPSYTKSIEQTKINAPKDYEIEGINYVFKIFCLLGKKYMPNDKSTVRGNSLGYFGYDGSINSELNLRLDEPFDSFTAQIVESNKIIG